MQIVDYIPTVCPISRAELSAVLDMPDRQVRKSIQKAREEGALIVSMTDGSGYQRVTPEDLPKLARQYRQNRARIISLAKQQKALRGILKEAGYDT